MFRSLHMKLMLIMTLLIISLMTVVGAFLINSVANYYTQDFYTQMSEAFGDPDFWKDLETPIEGEEDAASSIAHILDTNSTLGIDNRSRKYYVLDGTDGHWLAGSDDKESGQAMPNDSRNLMRVLAGEDASDDNSPAAEEMLGRSIPIGGSENYDTLFSDIAPLQGVLAVEQPGYLDGERDVGGRSLELLLTPFDQERLGGVLVVIHDVTEQRKTEELRREFVANVSHELRTPLTNIRSYAETLADNAGELPPNTEKNFLGVILNESDRMTHIVQDLLTLSRFDSGRAELKLAPFPFGQAVQDVYNANLMEAQRHGHAMELDITEELPEITGDRERIVQVMMNVVSNSIKYTPDGGRIRISAGRQDRRVWMEVADNGIGIPKEDRGRIFERFYRVDKARSRESGGTGLGLSIAKEIIDRHEGTIELVDRSGPGLTVRITLLVEGPHHGRE